MELSLLKLALRLLTVELSLLKVALRFLKMTVSYLSPILGLVAFILKERYTITSPRSVPNFLVLIEITFFRK